MAVAATVGQDELTVGSPGRELRSERVKKGLSLSELSRRSGVAKATLSRWENGLAFPDVATLQSVLLALGSERAQQSRYFAQVASPRGVRALREFDRKDGAFLAELGLRVPAFGDAIRGLRVRARVTAEELASRLGIARSTVSQWERSDRLPSETMARSLAEILGASETERGWLVARRLPVSTHNLKSDEAVVWLERLVETLSRDRQVNEVEAVCFEAEVWRLAQTCEFGAAILGQYYNVRAGAYCEEFRVDEIKRYARQARDLPFWKGPLVIGHVPESCLAWVEYGAGNLAHMAGTLRRLEAELARPLNWYQLWAGRLFLARFYAELKRVDDMEWSLTEAERVAARHVSSEQSLLFDGYVAECWDAVGRPDEALLHLPKQSPDIWAVPAHLENTRASALVSLGELDAARESVERVIQWVKKYGIAGIEVRNTLSRFAGATGSSLSDIMGDSVSLVDESARSKSVKKPGTKDL